MKWIGYIETERSRHTNLNATKGMVLCHDLLNYTEEETATELAPQGVMACWKLTVRRERQKFPSAHTSRPLTRQHCQRKF